MATLPIISRRKFITRATVGSAAILSGCVHQRETFKPAKQRLFFTSAGKTCLVDSDGGNLETLELEMPNQVTWQPGPFLPDGKRVIFLSMEQRRDGPGRPFEQYYTQTPTHLWLYDLEQRKLSEIATRERKAVFYTPALLLGDDRILVQVVKDKVGQIFNMNLDGTDAREFTRAGEGLPYGLSASPDGRRVAFHLASPRGYEIWTCDADGGNRVRVAAHPDHLYFGTSWSPDGNWILYQDCHFKSDPGHDWSDICIGCADGAEHRVLTSGQSQWFAATYGNAATRGGGSNMPTWTSDGQILFSRKLPDSKVPWEFQPQRPDTDHFNRDFKPELARGGAQICLLNPANGIVKALTQAEAQVWDFRAAESPYGNLIHFCRAPTGSPPSIYVMDADGENVRRIATGLEGQGADHPRWLPKRRER